MVHFLPERSHGIRPHKLQLKNKAAVRMLPSTSSGVVMRDVRQRYGDPSWGEVECLIAAWYVIGDPIVQLPLVSDEKKRHFPPG